MRKKSSAPKKKVKKLLWRGAVVLIGLVGITIGTILWARAQTAPAAGQSAAPTVSVVRAYRLRDRTVGYGLTPTADGGYLFSGDTVYSSGMGIWNAFLIKTNARGDAAWVKLLASQSAAQGELIETKRLVTQTKDKNFLLAADIIDFYDTKYEERKEGWGDVLVTKVNSKGVVLWSVMLGDYGIDFPQRLWATEEGGALLLAKFKSLGYGPDPADMDVIRDYSVLIKLDKNGKVVWSKKMDWTATDMKYLADGSFVALADIDFRETEQLGLGTDLAPGKLPTVIKLDNELNVQWAKSIEAPPLTQTMVTTTGSAPATMYQARIRMSGGDFRAVEQAPDGNFVAFGRYFNTAAVIAGKNATLFLESLDSIPYIAVKISATGNYLWAKSLKTFQTARELNFQTVATADQGFVLMRNVARVPGFATLSTANDIELVKTDAELKPLWTTKVGWERDTTARVLRTTNDGGLAVLGTIVTDEEHLVMGSWEPYQDTVLLKVEDTGPQSTAIKVEEQTNNLVLMNIAVRSAPLDLAINKKVKEKISNGKNKIRNLLK